MSLIYSKNSNTYFLRGTIMRVKSLLCLALTTIVGSNSFALEIYKGHLISHKEWSTGNVKGGFVANKIMKSALASNHAASNDHGEQKNIISQIASYTGTVGSPVAVNSENSIYMLNVSETSKLYRYTYSLCADAIDKTAQCVYYSDAIQLDAGGYFNNVQAPQLQLIYATPGTYQTYTTTSLNTEDWTSVTGSTSVGSVTIS
jgi:hypothetical protein